MSLSYKFYERNINIYSEGNIITGNNSVRFNVVSNKLIKVFVYLTLFFIAAHIVTQAALYTIESSFAKKVSDLFNLDGEKNIPTYFASFLLLLSSVLLIMIYYAKKSEKSAIYWLVLSVIFLFVSMDEYIEFHERLMNIINRFHEFSGVLTFVWIIPYAAAFIIVSILFYRFYRTLPDKTKRGLFIAAALYLTGAMGFEMLGGLVYSSADGEKNLLFKVLSTIEEILEFAGTIIFIKTLFEYLRDNIFKFLITFDNPTSQSE